MRITINKQEYGFQWGLGAIEIFCDSMEMGFEALDVLASPNDRERTKSIVLLTLAGLQNYAELNNQDFTLTYRQLQAWLDDAPQNTFNEIMEDFSKSKYLGRTMYSYFGVDEPASPKKKSSSVNLSKSRTK